MNRCGQSRQDVGLRAGLAKSNGPRETPRAMARLLSHPAMPILAVVIGIATFSAMDATIKGAAIAIGAYSAVLLRNLGGALLALPLWWFRPRRRLRGPVLRVHVLRAAVVAVMAPLFFYGLVRIPLAEGIALSFIAPLIALYLASLMLGEKPQRAAIVATLLGLAGVLVIAAGRMGRGTWSHETAMGTCAVLVSAVFYAINLVLQRRQAQIAGPLEIAFFQSLFVGLLLVPAAPWLLQWPDPTAAGLVLAGAALATIALLFLSWGYARAEAQVLLPVEYTGFLWAALFGWALFGEWVSWTALAGAALIVTGCLLAARRHTEQTAV
jgi:drug/metabolite transporter (DMT)-like permease